MFSVYPPARNMGFTLLELLVAVAIVMIVATVAVPSMRSFIDDHTSYAARDDFNSAIVIAQQEALRTKNQVVLCPSTNGSSCATAWGENVGWLVYRDMGTSSIANDDILVSHPNSSAKKIISSDTSVTFFSTGHASVASFILCTSSSTTDAYSISISRAGRMDYAPTNATACS